MNRSAPILCAALAVAALAACSKRDAPPAAPPASAASTTQAAPADAGIAWVRAATDVEVDAAFARARSEGKPVFVYWGAKWCPPCNQLQATLFNRQDFIERSRAFVPVYVDGDKPGAQKLGLGSSAAAAADPGTSPDRGRRAAPAPNRSGPPRSRVADRPRGHSDPGPAHAR